MTTDMRSLTDAEINEVTGGCTEDAVPTETWTCLHAVRAGRPDCPWTGAEFLFLWRKPGDEGE